jgi:hypothetical protein
VLNEAAHAEYYQCLAKGTCGYGAILERGRFAVYAREREASDLRARCVGLR